MALDRVRAGGRTIGLVPTMGSLHEGHLSLIRRAAQECDVVVVSIFVNPTQFGPDEDLDQYPCDMAGDLRLCEREGVELVFCPTEAAMYPSSASTFVEETALSKVLCGASRPGHFRGVATVVAKLLLMIRPDVAVFGQKDAQQCRVIERMVRDLSIPTRIVRAPVVREADGLAMSSRNRYLSPSERAQATCLYDALRCAERMIAEGETEASVLRAAMRERIEREADAQVDYIEVVDDTHLRSVSDVRSNPVLLAVAVHIGKARLIDNLLLGSGHST